MRSLCALLLLGLLAGADAGAPFGDLPLIDVVRCGDPADEHPFHQDPAGAAQTQELLGCSCRVLPAAGAAKTMAWRIGRGKGLVAGRTYLLCVDFPEDVARSFLVLNRGAEQNRGIATGAALGDALWSYVGSNPESLRIPLSGAYRSYRTLFTLHERTAEVILPRDRGQRPNLPADGFWVVITQPEGIRDAASAGAAVASLRLFAVPDPARFDQPLRLPPGDLPRRHLCWREEMSDGVIASTRAEERGVADPVDWYRHKVRLMRFLGMDAFSKDLLEFGHNQGWDSGPGGGNDWIWQTPDPGRWERILALMASERIPVLPYYEYAGSIGKHGLGIEKRAKTLGGKPDFTHIAWTEKANLDLTDPDSLADARKLLDATILRFAKRNDFVGAWFRPRPSAWPIGFGDATLARFATDTATSVPTRAQLAADAALRGRYYQWWNGKRRDFLIALRDHLRGQGVPEALVLFTGYASEEGPGLEGNAIVTDDLAAWRTLLGRPGMKPNTPVDWAQTVARGRYAEVLHRPTATWGGWEWQHSVPVPDPAAYAQTPGLLVTYPFNKAYTVADPAALAGFRSPSGLALVRHYCLNENIIPEGQAGYVVADVDRAGPASMLAEVRAMASGDPTLIAYLASNSFNRGFPEYARSFNAAFLALPALSGEVVTGASADPEVVVRAIVTPHHGTWFAIINTSLADKPGLDLKLPGTGVLTNAVSGAEWSPSGRFLPACSLTSLHRP